MRIAIPVDIRAREFNGKLWLALNLASEGHEVILGDISLHKSIDLIKPDALFAHGAADYVHKIRQTGCTLVYMDTEGGVFQSEEAYADRIHHFSDSAHTFFVWGETQADIADEVGYRNIKITGNPRFDLLHEGLREMYAEKAGLLEREYGEFVLINTNFTRANAALHPEKDSITPPEEIEDYQDWVALKFAAFIDLIDYLSGELGNTTFVVRPHPSENHETYRRIFSEIENVVVEFKHSVRPWIYAAQATVHCGCTTGIESVIMDTPTIAYIPRDLPFANNLPNTVSHKAHSHSEVRGHIASALDDSFDVTLSSQQFSVLKSHFHNVDILAAPEIANEFGAIPGKYKGGYVPSVNNRFRRGLNATLGHKNVSRLRRTGIREGWYYSYQKFPYISDRKVRDKINFFLNHIEIGDVNVERIRRVENTFKITQKDRG